MFDEGNNISLLYIVRYVIAHILLHTHVAFNYRASFRDVLRFVCAHRLSTPILNIRLELCVAWVLKQTSQKCVPFNYVNLAGQNVRSNILVNIWRDDKIGENKRTTAFLTQNLNEFRFLHYPIFFRAAYFRYRMESNEMAHGINDGNPELNILCSTNYTCTFENSFFSLSLRAAQFLLFRKKQKTVRVHWLNR